MGQSLSTNLVSILNHKHGIKISKSTMDKYLERFHVDNEAKDIIHYINSVAENYVKEGSSGRFIDYLKDAVIPANIKTTV